MMNIPNIQITPVNGQKAEGAESFSTESENGALFAELMESQIGDEDLKSSEMITDEEEKEITGLEINLGVLTAVQSHLPQLKEVESENHLSPTNLLDLSFNLEVERSFEVETKLKPNDMTQPENYQAIESSETTLKEDLVFKNDAIKQLPQLSGIEKQYPLQKVIERSVFNELNPNSQATEGHGAKQPLLNTLVPTEISKELEAVFGDSLKTTDDLELGAQDAKNMPLLGTEFETLKIVNVRKLDEAVISLGQNESITSLGQTTVDGDMKGKPLGEKGVKTQIDPQDFKVNFSLPTELKPQPLEVTTSIQETTVRWDNKTEFEELMVKHASLMKDGDSTNLVIKLKPYSLGEMRISLEFKDGQLRGLIQLEKDDAKKIVEESLKMLQGEIKNSIIEVEQMATPFRDGGNLKDDSQQKGYPEENSKQRHASDEENLFEEALREVSSSGLELRV